MNTSMKRIKIFAAAAIMAVFGLMLMSALWSGSVYADHEDPPPEERSTIAPFDADENMWSPDPTVVLGNTLQIIEIQEINSNYKLGDIGRSPVGDFGLEVIAPYKIDFKLIYTDTIEAGGVYINYPVEVILTTPPAESFIAGETIVIDSSWRLQPLVVSPRNFVT